MFKKVYNNQVFSCDVFYVGNGNGSFTGSGTLQVGRRTARKHRHGPDGWTGQKGLVRVAETVGVKDGVAHGVDGQEDSGEDDVHGAVHGHAAVTQVEESAQRHAGHKVDSHELYDSVLQAAHLLVVDRLHVLCQSRDHKVAHPDEQKQEEVVRDHEESVAGGRISVSDENMR